MKEPVYAVESLARPLLGRSAAVKLNLMSRVSELTSDENRAKVMRDYPKLFTWSYEKGHQAEGRCETFRTLSSKKSSHATL